MLGAVGERASDAEALVLGADVFGPDFGGAGVGRAVAVQFHGHIPQQNPAIPTQAASADGAPARAMVASMRP